MIEKILKELIIKSSAQRKKINEWFFKTGIGQYGHGDIFIGVSVPDSRKVAKKYFEEIELKDLQKLLENKIHEVRLCALHKLVYKYKIGDEKIKRNIFKFYLKNLKYINNWDLVDTSAPQIVGDYLANFENRDTSILLKLAKSKNLWDRRVAIVACLYFIVKVKSPKEIFQIAEIVKLNKHDLLQKALGWMLREVYKRVDQGLVRKFLQENIKILPRTTLRYAIEKMDIMERKIWLAKK
jgi:3-methyladenine DNA glycosylase AlkD